MAGSHGLKRCFGGARQGLGKLDQGPEGGELAEHHHLDPGIPPHQHVNAPAHGGQVFYMGADRHLDAGDGKRGHGSSELSIGESGQRISAELAQGQADRRAAPGPVLDLCRATVA